MENKLGREHAGQFLQPAQAFPMFLDGGSFLDHHELAGFRVAGVDLEARLPVQQCFHFCETFRHGRDAESRNAPLVIGHASSHGVERPRIPQIQDFHLSA